MKRQPRHDGDLVKPLQHQTDTMNLILLHREDFISDDRVRLDDRRFAHIRDILSAEQGKQYQVGLLGGKVGIGTVSVVAQDAVELTVALTEEPPDPMPATLIIALPRPKVFRRVLQGITAMGVKRIVLLNSWHVDKSYWHSPVLTAESLQEQLFLGLEQARDTILPKVEIQRRFKPFVEDVSPINCERELCSCRTPERCSCLPSQPARDRHPGNRPGGWVYTL